MPIQMLIQPDLKTRESVMLAAGRAQFSVVTPDGVHYVKIECKRKTGPGSAKRYEQVTLAQATHVFISEKGYGTPRLGTYYPPSEGYTTGRFFPEMPEFHPHIAALKSIINFVNGAVKRAEFEEGYDLQVEDRCGLCGRKLEDPKSIQRGIGPECAGKPTGSKILHASAFGQQELPIEATLTEAEADAGLLQHLEVFADAVTTPSVTEQIEIVPPAFSDAELRLVRGAVHYRVREAGVTLDEAPEYKAIIEKIDAYLTLKN